MTHHTFPAHIVTVAMEGGTYNIIILELRKTYEVYMEPADASEPMAYMFGLPMEGTTLDQAFEMAAANLKEYIDLLTD